MSGPLLLHPGLTFPPQATQGEPGLLILVTLKMGRKLPFPLTKGTGERGKAPSFSSQL